MRRALATLVAAAALLAAALLAAALIAAGLIAAALLVPAAAGALPRGGCPSRQGVARCASTPTSVRARVRVRSSTRARARARVPLVLGLEDDPVFLQDPFAYGGVQLPTVLSRAAGLRRTAALGASLVKLTAQWRRIEVRPGVYDLARLSASVAAARTAGDRVMVLIGGPAPAWATADHREGVDRPSPVRFARFSAAVAVALRGRVWAYSVWNEPNWPSWLAPHRVSPRLYRGLYRAASSRLRLIDPRARILLGELAPLGTARGAIAPITFLRAMACRGCAPLDADGVALHPYTLRTPPEDPGHAGDATTGSLHRFVGVLDALQAAGTIVRRGGARLELHLTEWGFRAGARTLSEAQRARYAVDGLRLACAEPRVRSFVWYQLAAPPRVLGPQPWDSALLARNGTPRLTYRALAAHARSTCALAGR